MKYIAFYLPQYHRIPENDEWWGEGFTEWTNVKKAVPLFKGHYQPRIPLNNNYYNLDSDNEKTMKWQIKIAKENGVYGFCFYHYWFKKGKKLLERPVEKFLSNKSLDIPFCLCWANEPWTRTWDGGNNKIIMPQEYGEKKEWIEHFYYLLPFLKDSRYICIDNKPVIVIYRPEIITSLDEMLETWKDLAIKEGLSGLFLVSQGTSYNNRKRLSSYIDTCILYEPGYTQNEYSYKSANKIKKFFSDPRLAIHVEFEKIKAKISLKIGVKKPELTCRICDYDLFWKHIIKRKYENRMVIPGAFIDWDNSPRRGANEARIFKGATPEKFEKYMRLLKEKAEKETDLDMIFIDAWNEWGEGTYLEPDQKYGDRYLRAIKNIIST